VKLEAPVSEAEASEVEVGAAEEAEAVVREVKVGAAEEADMTGVTGGAPSSSSPPSSS
jgi:hypothetical protein